MGDARLPRRQHAYGGVWPRRRAGGRGDDDAGPLPVAARVVLYHAEGCHLCERARDVVARVRAELGFELEEIDVAGDPELEARYRELLPVIEIDGRRAFVYHVSPERLRQAVTAQSPPPGATL